MSRDKRGVVNPVVGGSSPPATANFRFTCYAAVKNIRFVSQRS